MAVATAVAAPLHSAARHRRSKTGTPSRDNAMPSTTAPTTYERAYEVTRTLRLHRAGTPDMHHVDWVVDPSGRSSAAGASVLGRHTP